MDALCAIVYYMKSKGGRLYPKAARTGPYAYANEVSRVNGEVVSKYIGIVRLPGDAHAEGGVDVVESGEGQNVVEKGEETDADDPR